MLGQGYKNILLNLRDVRHIDSAGVGELMSCYTSVRNQGGQLKLMNLNKHVHNLLQITKLYTIFEVVRRRRLGGGLVSNSLSRARIYLYQ